jgi:hypothetical protein
MNNRAIWGLAAVLAGSVCVLAVLANRHHSTIQNVGPGSVADVELPVASGPIGSGTPGAMAPQSGRVEREDKVALETPAPPTRPASRPVASRPVRAVKFADAVGNDELTPQKVARVALGYVGVDPVAEQVWEAAINNPNFTANERKDLIEDLNQEGFDDPKNLTAADLPLIVNRLQLIKNLAPQAADDVNAAAFAEAYKDLVNMLAKVTNG